MEKIVIFALVILSCVALSLSDSHTTTSMGSKTPVSPAPSSPHMPASSTPPPGPGPQPGTKAPTSGAVSFTASAGLVVSLVMALLH